jgi:hypothetical protein
VHGTLIAQGRRCLRELQEEDVVSRRDEPALGQSTADLQQHMPDERQRRTHRVELVVLPNGIGPAAPRQGPIEPRVRDPELAGQMQHECSAKAAVTLLSGVFLRRPMT